MSDVDLVRSFGATHVVDRGPGLAARVRTVCPDGVDALLDTALLGASAASAVRDGGQVVAERAWTGGHERDIRVHELPVGHYAKNGRAMADIRELAERGVLRPRVTEIVDLAGAADAHRRLAAGGLRGRIVLRLAD